jgi:hypothetical protein
MPNPKLLGIVTALLMAVGTPGAYAAYTSAQIKQIEQFVVAKQWGELRAYVKANPRLLKGNNALANALKPFMNSSNNAVLATMFEPGTGTY